MTTSYIPQTSRLKPNKVVMLAGLVIAFGIMGDSLMYSLLPLEAENLGIPLSLVGVLLSANRLVRLISNSWASLAFERWGPKIPFLVATLLGIVSTILYGGSYGFWVFLFARTIWGVAWSGFRQGGYQAVWGASEAAKGRLMGILWGIVRLGSGFSVLVGGYIYDQFGYAKAVSLVALITVISLPISVYFPWPKTPPQPERRKKPRRFHSLQAAFSTSSRRWLLAAGFMDTLFEGILGSTASLFLQRQISEDFNILGIGALAGLLLALRYVSGIVFGPFFGFLSDKIGQARILPLLTAAMLVSMMAALNLSGLWGLLCLALVFFCGSGTFTTLNAAASGLAQRTEHPHQFVGVFNTAIDAGAAVGPLLAFSAMGASGFSLLYLGSLAVLLFCAINFFSSERTRESNI